ncbi:hypothetical protein MOBT1_000767 [Malassezia obtusa]|uniref:Mitochondrial carrier n=1 Tax=Malassezia obtusa TaxID=76774 RepID=A0AAF0ISD4_9BASI|nr:hypothetical protein MOBT1_000767 [Malassezia obtusa]
MDSADAHRLRPYYKPRDDFSFVATAPMLNASRPPGGEAASASVRGADSTPTISLPNTSTNRYLSGDADLAGLDGTDRLSPGAVVKGLAVSAALQFTSNCLAMPFEVGKLLLQVQWVPNEQVWDRLHESHKGKKPPLPPMDMDDDPWSERRAWQDDEDDDEPDRYFRDESAPAKGASSDEHTRDTDENGYVMRSSIHDDDARPEFVMPIVAKGGVWEMIKAVARSKERWMGLWKGTLTTFLLDVSTNTIQPMITGILSLFAPAALNAMPIAFSPKPFTTLGLLTLSHVVTGAIVSPLDLVRTRLIAQSTLPSHRKYAGPFEALRTILREEGGWRTTYFTPLLFIPTVLDYLFRSVLTLGAPLLIENTFHLDPSAVPVSYALSELAISTLSLCITLPIETVRRRLQLQYHPPLPSARPAALGKVQHANTARVGLRTCVETRPVPYSGVFECMYRIVSEETSVAPHLGQPRDDGGVQSLVARGYSSIGGLRNLFRGFGMGFTANLLVFVLTLITGERQSGNGWTEM